MKNFSTKSIALTLLALHCTLLAWSSHRNSPTFHEVGHLAAGISHVSFGRFELYRVNPPLVRMVAALPVLLASPATDWSSYETHPTVRSEFAVGTDFLKANPARFVWLFTLGRLGCIIFSLIGGYVCFRWASLLYGSNSGLLAVALWCFCPTILGHGALIMPDVGAAALGLAACYCYWRWLRKPTWPAAAVAGVMLGLAELTKTTMLVFYPVWLALWIIYRLSGDDRTKTNWIRESSVVLFIFFSSMYVINLGYAFDGSFVQLSDYSFVSKALTDFDASGNLAPGRNRFFGSWFASIPVPLPKDYVLGIDQQKADFEEEIRCYLAGSSQIGGWWYFYLYALAVKIPLGTWTLVLLAAVVSIFCGYCKSLGDELTILVPALSILCLVSSQTGFTIHMRYVLPAIPFFFVWVSKLARSFELRHPQLLRATCFAFVWSLTSSMWIYPHSISYFNEAVGGPRNGHAHLLESNIAWGQDLLFLKQWLKRHHEVKELHLITRAWTDPKLLGIDFRLPPLGPASANCNSNPPDDILGPRPGWYAVDVNFLRGSHILATNEAGEWFNVTDNCYNYTYFRHFRPVAMAGYSIHVFHITPEEADRIRRMLNLPSLPRDP